jgi:hypothetical protein
MTVDLALGQPRSGRALSRPEDRSTRLTGAIQYCAKLHAGDQHQTVSGISISWFSRPSDPWGLWPIRRSPRFPCKELACMPGSPTTPSHPSACIDALGCIAFRYTDSVGARDQFSIAAQWLACTSPCRRFADVLTDACARLGADVDRYSFIAVDFHYLLLTGLPAHLCENHRSAIKRRTTGTLILRCRPAPAYGSSRA